MQDTNVFTSEDLSEELIKQHIKIFIEIILHFVEKRCRLLCLVFVLGVADSVVLNDSGNQVG